MNDQFWKIRKWETDRLRGLSVYSQLMYTLGFAARCDYGSGVFKARMSQQAWWELLSAVPQKGSNKDWNKANGLPDLHKQPEAFKSFIRARRVELERAGLIKKVSAYIYSLCVYTECELIRSEYEHPKNTTKNTRLNSSNSLNNNDSSVYEHSQEHPKNTPPHYKKKKTTVDAFVMTDDWEPSEGFADMVLSGLGLDVTVGGKHEWLLSRGLMENRMYYQSGEWVTHSETQHGWHRRLIHQMKVIYRAKKDESTTKSSNVVPIAKAANAYRKKQDGSLIPRVPNFVDQKAMLDWWKQHAKLGAPSVSAKRYNDYKEWRYDLDQWRTNHLLELKKKEQG